MLPKDDPLLCTISRRREKVSMMIIMASIKITRITSMDDNDMQVASVLEGSASKSDWAAIRRCTDGDLDESGDLDGDDDDLDDVVDDDVHCSGIQLV